MEPKKKNSRKNHEREEEKHDLDRLSSLPDSIITHIFSFLDLESVIRTSVLSTRYKLLWTLSPCLDIRLPGTDRRVSESSPQKRCARDFESYVTHVLQFREHSNLVKFRLSLHNHVGKDFAENCVRYAADHKVQHFRMRGFFYGRPIALPKSLLNSPRLISLNLRNATSDNIELPKSLSLPSLKLLCLKNFEFSDKNYNGELLVGCPSLETLYLYKCSIKPVNKIKAFDVSCSNLRHWRSPWRCFDEHRINVNAPKLALFQFQGHLARVNFKEVLHCLETACFDLSCPIACININGKERLRKTSECFLSMLLNVCNVKVISLSLKTIEIVCFCGNLCARAPVIFENLRIIKFTYANTSGEETIKMKTTRRLLKKIRVKAWPLQIYKVKEALSEDKSWLKPIPSDFMHFLLENSPGAELLTVVIPNVCFFQGSKKMLEK